MATSTPALIAHRGFAGSLPQNTVLAVERAAAHPDTGMVEVDVRPAADGTPIVFHDTRLGAGDGRAAGLTDGEGVVHETPLTAVTAAEVLGSGETVPTLAAVVDACPADVRLNVELKNPGSLDIRPGMRLDREALTTQRAVWRPFVERVLEECAGADASHRGGDPGFVDVDRDRIVSPDYPGNGVFCTLGNVEAHGRVGLLFVDFSDGRTLQVTGRADIVRDEARVAQYEGAERLVEITAERSVELTDGNPLRWSLEERSPFDP
jgi:hypothetical protein